MKQLVIVTNRKLCQGDFFDRIRLLCEAGVDKIILREKDLSRQEYAVIAEKVSKECKGYPVQCILHSHVEVAGKLLSERRFAGGIHVSVPLLKELGQAVQDFEPVNHLSSVKEQMLKVLQGNTLKREAFLLGVSTHSLEEIFLAQEFGADYVFYSPIFETSCKPGVVPKGMESLKEICEKAVLPVYALGGIAPENAELCLKAGAAGVCVMSWGMTASFDEIVNLGNICHEF